MKIAFLAEMEPVWGVNSSCECVSSKGKQNKINSKEKNLKKNRKKQQKQQQKKPNPIYYRVKLS